MCVCVSCICQRTDLAGEKMREKSDTNREYMCLICRPRERERERHEDNGCCGSVTNA